MSTGATRLCFTAVSAWFFVVTAGNLQAQARLDPVADAPPKVQREFRAMWIASVANIDWPSQPGLSVWEQQRELLIILDRAVTLKMNAVILQVRPASDALYNSRYEPWSEYLTGEMGRAPEPFYDPLTFAVAEAHKRGLELHAWFNPFRAHHASGGTDFSTNHLKLARPGIVREYGRSLWLDPGEPAVRAHSLRVVLDVVRRYDIDGAHIDDYFYPYRERDSAGVPAEFPDDASYARYRKAQGQLGKNDWRRRNVNLFVRAVHVGIKGVKPWVRFGVSPFGIWRPGNPSQVRGLDAYQEIYADSRKWLREGWLDYFTPQLYWEVGAPQQSYPVLLRWWVGENVKKRHIWPGLFTSRIESEDQVRRWDSGEILEQIRRTRAQPGSDGHVHFSARALLRNLDGISDSLLTGPYAEMALVPASPWLDRVPPSAPTIIVRRDTIAGGVVVTMKPFAKESVWLWVVRARTAGLWSTSVLPGWQRLHTLTRDDSAAVPELVTVSAVDRVGNEGKAARKTFR